MTSTPVWLRYPPYPLMTERHALSERHEQTIIDAIGLDTYRSLAAPLKAIARLWDGRRRVRRQATSAKKSETLPPTRATELDVELPLQITTTNGGSGQVSGPCL